MSRLYFSRCLRNLYRYHERPFDHALLTMFKGLTARALYRGQGWRIRLKATIQFNLWSPSPAIKIEDAAALFDTIPKGEGVGAH